MARIRAEKVKDLSTNGSYFQLKGDGDTAEVRFMYNDKEDLYGYSVHEVKVGDGTRYVDCLREHGDKVDACPLCAEGNRPIGRFFLKLYNEETKEIQIWERGNTIWQALEARLRRVRGPLVSTVFEITRIGKPRDPKTTYDIFPIEEDDTMLEDLPEAPKVVGNIVLSKTYEELEDYLETGSFEDFGGQQVEDRRASRGGRNERKVSRNERPTRDRRANLDEEEDERPARRTRREEPVEDERPTRRAQREEVEEKPVRRSRRVEEDEVEEVAPRRRTRRVEEDEEEAPAPRRRAKVVDEELEEFDGENIIDELEDSADLDEEVVVAEAPRRRGRR